MRQGISERRWNRLVLRSGAEQIIETLRGSIKLVDIPELAGWSPSRLHVTKEGAQWSIQPEDKEVPFTLIGMSAHRQIVSGGPAFATDLDGLSRGLVGLSSRR